MKSNKKTISIFLTSVIAIIFSCSASANSKMDIDNTNDCINLKKTTTYINGKLKNETIVNGIVVSSYFLHNPKTNKLISSQSMIDAVKMKEQINAKVNSILTNIDAKINSILNDITDNSTETTIQQITETEHTTDNIFTESTTEITTANSANTNNNFSYSEYVKKVVELTNAEREKYGLQPLQLSDALCRAAQEHAEDMNSKNYFSHISQDGKTMSDRIERYLTDYNCLGENIAYGYTSPESVVQGWMNSEGHRANILERNFKYIGIGYSNTYWVQDFSG